MMKIRRSEERGKADFGWLKSYHTFSFGQYYDPANMGFKDLRVINEDRIVGGSGFPTHSHKDMEIISYVIEGALEHSDSMGNKTVIRPGEVQRMSAGTGVSHSEYNAFPDKTTHFLQIWILPKQRDLPAGYGQRSFENELSTGDLTLVTSASGRNGSISISQDVDLYISRMPQGKEQQHELRQGRGAWIQVIKGSIGVDGETLTAGDGAALVDSTLIKWRSKEPSEILLFDLV